MKILVFMSDNRNFEDQLYVKLTAAINKEYCKKHNYDFLYYQPYLEGEDSPILNCLDPNTLELRHAAWSKILATKKALSLDYDYVVYLDSDCVFNDFDKRIESVIEEHPSANLIFFRDYISEERGLLPNSGFYICKVCDDSRSFINDWYNVDSREFNTKHSWDQSGLWKIYRFDDKVVTTHDFMFHPSVFPDLPIQLLRHITWGERHHRILFFTEVINSKNIPVDENIGSIEVVRFDTSRAMCNDADIVSNYTAHKDEMNLILTDLEKLIVDSNVLLEGNSFYYHQTLHKFDALYKKQANLWWCGKRATSRICEIGFNAGHSTMLMLLGRESTPLYFTIFDIGHHAYTRPCVEHIQSKFPHVTFEYVEGDSTITMPTWINENKSLIGSYDVVHVDGGHSEHCISNDMTNSDILLKKNGILIVDDTDDYCINNYVDSYISSGRYRELSLIATEGYPHRVLHKIN